MKTLLIGLHAGFKAEATLDYAVALAKIFDAHVIGYYPIPATLFMPVVAEVGIGVSDDALKSFYERRLPGVRDAFTQRLERTGLTFEFKSEELYAADPAMAIAREGRCADVIVVTGPDADKKHMLDTIGSIADIVMAAGRPVIVVPKTGRNTFALNRVGLAWNGSREATRAAFDALPILRHAKETLLSWINPGRATDDSLPGADLAEAFASHDVKLTLMPLRGRKKVGSSLGSLVEEHDLDLLVMGAYGRSRLRERILGGATQTVLSDLPCPVLLSN